SASSGTSPTPTTIAAPSAQTANARLSGDPLDVKAIVAKLGPSVVSINTQVTQRRGPFIQQGQGAGTGVILTAAGEVLSNAHVVAGATEVSVSLNGSDQELAAEIVNVDTTHDLAL